MATVNHLRNIENQRSILEVSFGRHAVAGDLCYSYSTGSDPTHYVYGYLALGEGEWSSMEGGWYNGLEVPEADIHFHSGALSTAMETGDQTVDSYFAEDVPHSRTAAVGFKLPQGIGDVNTSESPPTDFTGIFLCKKCNDFDSDGYPDGFGYSVNPALVIGELIYRYARIPNLPSVYTDMVEYWRNRIDWARWQDFRDFHDQTESVDYFSIDDFAGIGVTARYYDDATFSTLFVKRIEPSIDLQMGSGSPAVGMSTNNYSGRLEGQLKPEYTETYTFHVIADSVKFQLWINGTSIINQSSAEVSGTYTGTAALTADTSATIKLEFVDITGNAGIRLDWSSSSQAQQTIPMKRMYPKVEDETIYETHMALRAQTSIMDGIREALFLSNSIMQEVDGKLRFYAIEELTSSFTFNSDNIVEGSFVFERSDILVENPVTRFEASMRDVLSQYLEKPVIPVSYDVPWLESRTRENIRILDLHNCSQWQARKVLEAQANMEMGANYAIRLASLNSHSYKVIAGDRITINHRKTGSVNKDYLVVESSDAESEYSEGLDTAALRRNFIFHEWNF